MGRSQIRSALATELSLRHALAARELARRTNVESSARALLGRWRAPAPLTPLASVEICDGSALAVAGA